MPKFIPGLKLCRLFYEQEVTPILNKNFPRLRNSAAIIGWGSEVLGFDTPIFRDHYWGRRLLLFLSEKDFRRLKGEISEALFDQLLYEFMVYLSNYREPERKVVSHP